MLPHYKHAFSGVSPSFLASAVRGLFTGKRLVIASLHCSVEIIIIIIVTKISN